MQEKRGYQSLFEMAKVGEIDDLTIEVYNDHAPAHFHVIKKDKYEVRISIKDLTILSYKWQNKNAELSSSDFKKIKKWLKQKFKKREITNKDAIEIFWDGMNF